MSLLNKKLLCDGLWLLEQIQYGSIDCCFFDPQYRSNLDKLKFGNEGKSRMSGRSNLPQMSEDVICSFLRNIFFVMKQSSYLFFWVDKFILAEGKHIEWFNEIDSTFAPILVDMITWDKEIIGMGKRSRRRSEFVLVYQAQPKTTKNWKIRNIPDVWTEKLNKPRTKGFHPHRKPVGLLSELILSTTVEGDVVLDPCAGSFLTMECAISNRRNFIGCDISKEYGEIVP